MGPMRGIVSVRAVETWLSVALGSASCCSWARRSASPTPTEPGQARNSRGPGVKIDADQLVTEIRQTRKKVDLLTKQIAGDARRSGRAKNR